MPRRLFVAIRLPEEAKAKVTEVIKQWHWLPIRWLAPEHWHITILPPFYADNDNLALLTDQLKKRSLGDSFVVRFSRIGFAPPGAQARMIWLEGEMPRELVRLTHLIEEISFALLGPAARNLREHKLHVTLARFPPGDLRELQEKVSVLGSIKIHFWVEEISIMESHLRPEGADYETILAIPLREKGISAPR